MIVVRSRANAGATKRHIAWSQPKPWANSIAGPLPDTVTAWRARTSAAAVAQGGTAARTEDGDIDDRFGRGDGDIVADPVAGRTAKRPAGFAQRDASRAR